MRLAGSQSRSWFYRRATAARSAHSRIVLLTLCVPILLVGSGCATLQSERDAVARYEKTRQEMQRVASGDWQKPTYSEEKARVSAKSSLSQSDMAPKNWKTAWKKLIGRGPNAQEAERLYKQALAEYERAMPLLQQKSSDEARSVLLTAAETFEEAAERWPESSLEQNALFYAGEAYFFADHYPQSNDCFELLLKHHPNSRYLDHMQQRRFAMAQYWLDVYKQKDPSWYTVNWSDPSCPKMGLFGRSMKVFDRIRLDDPTGRLADDATLALANAYFAEESFGKADEYYTDLRRTFPSSEHQFTAHFVGLKAKLMCYEGPDYGVAPLDDAAKLVETIRRQFPVEAEREREFLARAHAETRFKKAEREYLTAKYFDQKAEYGAAKQYFATVINDYGDTPFAEESRVRVAELGGLPESPPQRFEWLVDIFPKEQNVRPILATDKPKSKKR